MAGKLRSVCSIKVMPKDELEAARAKFYFAHTHGRSLTTADLKYENNCLIIYARGFDGRCAYCRKFRLSLKRQCIVFWVECPLESRVGKEYQVNIGGRIFNQTYLEDEATLKRYLAQCKENQKKLEALVVLGVLFEYQGQFADAVSSYWRAYELDKGNEFARNRLLENLEYILRILPEEE